MRVLVTGGAGFIGTNLARRDPSIEWVCFDNFATGRKPDAQAAQYAEIIEGDIRSGESMRAALRGVDAVVHLAAQTGVPLSVENPIGDLESNIVGSVNLLEACRHVGVDRAVLASSAAPLGAATPPASENLLPQPISPYGASKLAMEAYAGVYRETFGLATFVLRFSNVYGPYSYLKGSVVARWMKLLLGGESITINGDGNQTRDFVHVDDICDAILLSLRSQRDIGGLYQLGTGVETRVRDVALAMTDLFEHDFESAVNFGPALAADVARSYCDITNARMHLGYDPAWSVDDGLASTLDWFRSIDPSLLIAR